jgi:hypothetical protein
MTPIFLQMIPPTEQVYGDVYYLFLYFYLFLFNDVSHSLEYIVPNNHMTSEY